MVAPVPDPSAPAERTVHGASETNREAAGAARKRASMLSFRDQVHVVVLNREMNDPEIGVPGRSDGAAHGGEHTRGAKAANRVDRPEGEVNRVSGDVLWARTVSDRVPTSGRELPACTASAPAPRTRRRQEELLRSTGHDLDWANLAF